MRAPAAHASALFLSPEKWERAQVPTRSSCHNREIVVEDGRAGPCQFAFFDIQF